MGRTNIQPSGVKMRSKKWLSAVALLAGLGSVRVSMGLTFTTLDDPSALKNSQNGTYAQGTNGNEIVGFYDNGSTHGFIYNISSGQYSTVNEPSAVPATGGTFLEGIYGNDLVGSYTTSVGDYGFFYNGTSYTTIVDPAATPGNTQAEATNGNIVVGYYYNSSTGIHAFSYNIANAAYTTLDDTSPGTVQTFAFGISGNDISGSFSDALGVHGFVYNGTSYSTLDDPAAGGYYTQATGIYNTDVVGYYQSTSGEYDGFYYDGNSYVPLNDSLATDGTFAYGVYGNLVTGEFDNATGYHGFFTIVPEPGSAMIAGIGCAGWLGRRRGGGNSKLKCQMEKF